MANVQSQSQVPAAEPLARTEAGRTQRPEIAVSDRQLRDIVHDAQQVLVQANQRRIRNAAGFRLERESPPPLFVRGGSLVRLERLATGHTRLSALTANDIRDVLVREADWVSETRSGKRSAAPPRELGRDLLTYPPSGVPRVNSISTIPAFGRSGQLLVTPGLHAAERLWLDLDPSLRLDPVPDSPTPDQIGAARAAFLDGLFVDFPFAADSDRAHAIAAVLLPFMRRLIEGCIPLHLLDGPANRAQQKLFCSLVSIVATGQPCDARTLPQSERKHAHRRAPQRARRDCPGCGQ